MFRCPKCNGRDITISEHFTVSSDMFFSDGVCVGTIGQQGGNSQGKFSGVCNLCDHRWTAKYETGQKAVEAAHIFESTQ